MIWTVEACLRRADEAEALARTVTYEKDRLRLREEAEGWREHAARMQAHADHWREPAPVSWFRAVGARVFKRRVSAGPQRPRDDGRRLRG